MPEPRRPLPVRPSLEHDRKEAKELLRAVRQLDSGALKRVRQVHPAFQETSPATLAGGRFTLRDAQLVLAGEYGFDNWADWKDYVESDSQDLQRLFAVAQRAIQGRDPERLREILRRAPALVRLRNESGEDLLSQTLSYANFVSDQAAFWTCTTCAEALVEAGAEVLQVRPPQGGSLAPPAGSPRRSGSTD